MGIARALTAALAIGCAGAAQAQQATSPQQERSFCRDLDRVIRAAPDFLFLQRSRGAPPRFGFPQGCRVTAAAGRVPAAWTCHQNVAPAHMSRASLAALTVACLPEARRTAGSPRETIFTVPAARIIISEHGGPRARAGRIVTLRIEATPGQ